MGAHHLESLSMSRSIIFVALMVLLAGCKKQAEPSARAAATLNSGGANPEAAKATAPSGSAAPSNATAVSAFSHYGDPPSVDVGLSIEQAYAAIPHRRTVWTDSETTVPAGERAYLTAIFAVVDEAIAVRVAGLQNFSQQRFDAVDLDGQFDRLISYARTMPVPSRLNGYHGQILAALSADRQFFNEWKAQGADFPYARQIARHASVQAASSAARAAYSELMSKYPSESQANKDAFFDYHCALDFL
jgi:hypothetical protein